MGGKIVLRSRAQYMERMIILDKEQHSSNADVTRPSISRATNSV